MWLKSFVAWTIKVKCETEQICKFVWSGGPTQLTFVLFRLCINYIFSLWLTYPLSTWAIMFHKIFLIYFAQSSIWRFTAPFATVSPSQANLSSSESIFPLLNLLSLCSVDIVFYRPSFLIICPRKFNFIFQIVDISIFLFLFYLNTSSIIRSRLNFCRSIWAVYI